MGLTTLTGPGAIIYGRSSMVLVLFESWDKNLPPWCIFSLPSSIERAWETETWWKWHFFSWFSHFGRAWCHQLWSEVKYFCIFEFSDQKPMNKALFRFPAWFLASEIQDLKKSSKTLQNPIQIWPQNGNFRPFYWMDLRSYLSEILSNSHYLDHFERKKVWPKFFFSNLQSTIHSI